MTNRSRFKTIVTRIMCTYNTALVTGQLSREESTRIKKILPQREMNRDTGTDTRYLSQDIEILSCNNLFKDS